MTKDNKIGEATLHAYADGELDDASRLEVEQLLEDNQEDAELLKDWSEQREKLKAAYDPVLSEEIPESMLEPLADGKSNAGWGTYFTQIAASMIFMAVGAYLGWYLSLPDKPKWPALAKQAVGSHAVYTSDTARLVEVPASRPNGLRAWIKRRMGAEVTIPDFSEAGFKLVGGRIIPLDGKPAAFFLYRNDQQQKLSLFIAHDKSVLNNIEKLWVKGDVKCLFWFQDSLGMALTGDLDEAVLRNLTQKTQAHFSKI